jgi:vanillate/4-hydroxybenzoate decarboxylase subunit D
MHSFPRPTERHLFAERRRVEGACPECGAQELAEYRVLSEGGWWDVRKCQRCLCSVSRERGPLFGAYVPLGLEITT